MNYHQFTGTLNHQAIQGNEAIRRMLPP